MLRQKQAYDQEFEDFEDIPPYQDDQAIPENEIKTVYLYAYTEDPEKGFVWSTDRVISGLTVFLAFVLLVGLCLTGLVFPSTSSYAVKTISIPAQFVTQDLQATVTLVPTGSKTDPATYAHGTLTIYNASFLNQSLPAGFVLRTQSGIAIMTDVAVTIPANNPPADGTATVSAHALLAGAEGNIIAGAINVVYGSSLYIKNLVAFSGGQDALTLHYATSQDQAKALATARAQLAVKRHAGMQVRPCTETVRQTLLTLVVAWTCQLVQYHLPHGLQALSVQLVGKNVLIQVSVPPPPVARHVAK